MSKVKGNKLYLVVSMLLLISLLNAACTTSKQAATQMKEESEGDSRPTIRIAMQANPNVENFSTNHYTKLIEEALDVKLEFLELPSKGDEALTKLALMVSSGEQLPDVINMYLGEFTIYDYASKGIFLPLGDYLNDSELAVNFNKIPEKEFILKNITHADGKIYSVPRYIPEHWNEGSHRAWINKEWLQNLNLSMPQTTDELYDVLKAFTTMDPNENGKQDEVGIVGSTSGWSQNPRVYLMNSFIYADPNTGYLMVKDGEIIPSFTQPEWKEGLEYMHRLVQDGLLSTLSFTQDETQLKALINVDKGMAGMVTSGSYAAFGPELQNNMVLLPPVAGPKGVQVTPYSPTLPTQLWFITKDAKDPELVFQVGDYLLNPEMALVNRYGEKGVDWSDDPEVAAQYIADYEESEGIKAQIAVLNTGIWNNPQNKHWNDAAPGYRSRDLVKTVAALKREEQSALSAPNWKPAFSEGYASLFPEEVISRITYTPEELKKIANSKTAIEEYINTSAVAFITGNLPFTQWDTYLKELEKMGLAQYLEITQSAYDRNK